VFRWWFFENSDSYVSRNLDYYFQIRIQHVIYSGSVAHTADCWTGQVVGPPALPCFIAELGQLLCSRPTCKQYTMRSWAAPLAQEIKSGLWGGGGAFLRDVCKTTRRRNTQDFHRCENLGSRIMQHVVLSKEQQRLGMLKTVRVGVGRGGGGGVFLRRGELGNFVC
jgi:hypothetical protein